MLPLADNFANALGDQRVHCAMTGQECSRDGHRHVLRVVFRYLTGVICVPWTWLTASSAARPAKVH